MRTQDIEIILKIKELGSFSRAADSLTLSQPAVSLAVKRVEEELNVKIFNRSGATVTLTNDGQRVARSFDRMLEIFDGIKGRQADMQTLRIGLSPLLGGRDVVRLLSSYFRLQSVGFVIEFLDSQELAARSDFDVRILVPGIKRRSKVTIEFPTEWIGVNNGVFIRSKLEAAIWERAMYALIDRGVQVSKVIEVNDCEHAYYIASSGAGFTPCVMTKDSAFNRHVLPHMPPLPAIHLDIFADEDVAAMLQEALLSHERSPQTMAAVS